jgi:hypothetical protein
VHVAPTAEGRGDLTAPAAEVVLVDDEQRGAVFGGQIGHRDAGDRDLPLGSANKVAGPHFRGQRHGICGAHGAWRRAAVVDLLGVPWAGRVSVHMRSGADTPRMASPLPIT